jgi:Zn-dependent metalloprotease
MNNNMYTTKKSQENHNHNSIHAICHIIPPIILENVIKKGNEEEKKMALAVLVESSRARARREILPAVISTFGLATGLTRTIYDAKHQTNKGEPVRNENQSPSADEDVNRAYDYSGNTYKFYKEVLGWNSLNNKGMQLLSTVHYGTKYNNAFWDGSEMYYGDGDGNIFNSFTSCMEIVGHELSHGVVSNTSDLIYQYQSGALNESFADVFGVLTKMYNDDKTVDDDEYWIQGVGLFTSNVQEGKGIRSLADPGTAYNDPVLGKDIQPAHMNNYKDLDLHDDNGGVHINSGIPNKAFYNVAMELGGRAWEKAGKIWFITLRDRLNQQSQFKDAAIATFDQAGVLYGNNSTEQKAVKKGWTDVGVEADWP